MTASARILVCSELGRASEPAIRRAASIAKSLGAAVEVLHVVDQPGDELVRDLRFDDPALHDKLRQAAQQVLEKQVRRCWPSGLPMPQVAVRIGPASRQICSHVEEGGFSLVITGARGGGTLKKYFIGTTATRVVRKLKVPVLIVRRPPEEAYKRVLVPVDFSDYSRRSIEQVRALLPSARLTLMHAYEAPYEGMMAHSGVEESSVQHYVRKARDAANDGLRAMGQAAGLQPGRFSVLVRHGHAYREVLQAEHESAFDCIAIGKHGRGFFNELLLGSTTEHVILESRADVLVIPLPA